MIPTDKKFVFLGGVHRSGTSLMHEILRDHPNVSGFENTGVPEDEGQHLQSIFPPAVMFGGPGEFGFHDAARMDEKHPLATSTNAEALFEQWSHHWDLTKEWLIEKSPPNLIRTRFFQHLFPESRFVILLRHPMAVAYATKKWTRRSIVELADHTLRCYELFQEDRRHLRNAFVMRYEDFVCEPEESLNRLLAWLGLSPASISKEVRPGVNEKYFERWRNDERSPWRRWRVSRAARRLNLESRAGAFGYSFDVESPISPLPDNGFFAFHLDRA